MKNVALQYEKLVAVLGMSAPWLGMLFLRMLIGWEFLESGLEKWHGENWFADIQEQFPFPFNIIPANISWAMATWFEVLGGIALMVGLGTRFFSLSLIVLTIVATAAVHWPSEWSSISELWRGYAITNNGYGNFKLPLLFLVMLWPLLFYGAGKLSLDAVIARLNYRLTLRGKL